MLIVLISRLVELAVLVADGLSPEYERVDLLVADPALLPLIQMVIVEGPLLRSRHIALVADDADEVEPVPVGFAWLLGLVIYHNILLNHLQLQTFLNKLLSAIGVEFLVLLNNIVRTVPRLQPFLFKLFDVKLELKRGLDGLALDSLEQKFFDAFSDSWVVAQVEGDEAAGFVEADADAFDYFFGEACVA